MSAEIEIIRTACPHDCPSACALEVERLSRTRIGRIRGAANLPFTAGVVCEKVGRYAERVHHPDRLTHPMRRIGAKGEGKFERISWDEALDTIAAAFDNAAKTLGAESVWPYHSGGTLGIVQRFGMERLSRLLGYSGMKGTICVTPGVSGWQAGVGAQRGADPVEIEATDLIVVWGGNPVHTNVNLMNHIQKARKTNGAKLVVVDVYRTSTMAAADIGIVLNPGTDGALACAMMQVMLAEGMADETFLAELTDFDTDVRTHLAKKTPEWAAEITGIPAAEIRAFARLYGRTAKSFLRLGVGFTRSRNGASNMHAVSCLPAITGAWRHKGGGAFFASFDIWNLDTTLAHADRLGGQRYAGARSIAHRGGPLRRRRRAGRRPTREGDVDTEFQYGDGRAGLGGCAPRPVPRRPLRLRARTFHDTDRTLRGYSAAGGDVPRTRRYLHGLGPHRPDHRPSRPRRPRRVPQQPRRRQCIGETARCRSSKRLDVLRNFGRRDLTSVKERFFGGRRQTRMDRLRTRFRRRTFPNRLSTPGRPFPVQAGLGRDWSVS